MSKVFKLYIYKNNSQDILEPFNEKNKNKLIEAAIKKKTLTIKTPNQEMVFNPFNWDYFCFEEIKEKENDTK